MMKKLLLRRGIALLMSILLAASAGVRAQSLADIKQNAKAAKVTTDLLNVIATGNTAPSVSPNGLAPLNLYRTSGNMIAIDAVANSEGEGQALLQALQGIGLQKAVMAKHRVTGYLPIDRLNDLRNISALKMARPSYKPIHNAGSVLSQGDAAMRADVARATYSVTGAGVKVGVLSDSYNNLGGAADGVASGDLPTGVEVLADLSSNDGSDEGRAMIELIHDIAPGSPQAFHTAFEGQLDFAQGIRDLAAAGCKVITDDVFYYAEPFFQDGPIAQAVDEVVNNGIPYFSSAGNSARQSYQSAYNPTAPPTTPSYEIGAHNFGGGDIYQRFTMSAGQQVVFSFQWDDPFFSVSGGAGAQTDMDILVYVNGTFNAGLSGTSVNVGGDAVEVIGFSYSGSTPINIDLVLAKYEGPNPGIVKWVNFGSNVSVEYDTKSSTVLGHANSARAIATGAAPFYNTPAFNSSLTTAIIEPFSSAGGTPIYFTTSGARLGSPLVRQKPEITAVDGTNTTFFYADSPSDPDSYPNFFGTSAAAPHAAAVAALMKEKVPAITPATVLSTLQSTALDMDDPSTPGFDTGFDYGTGFGFIQADRALQAISPTANRAPVVANAIPAQTATVNQPFSYMIPSNTFSDPDGDALTLSVSNLPPGLMFVAPATISGTPTTTTGSPFSVNVTATDPGNLSASTTFMLTVNPAGSNRAPVVANAIPAQMATVNQPFSYMIPSNTFSDPDGDALTLSVSNLPPGLMFMAPATISGTPTTTTGSPFSVNVTATDPGNLSASTTFMLTVNPADSNPSNFAIVNVTQVSCETISAGARRLTFTPQYTGLTGAPVSFSVVNEMPATTASGPYMLRLYTDNPVITLNAVQSGTRASYVYNWLSVCQGNPPPSGFAITGVSLVNCETISAGERRVTFTPQYTGLSGSPVSFSVVNEMPATTASGPYMLRLYTDNPVITLNAVQDGSNASYVYNWLAACTSNARLGVVSEATAELKATLFPNPVNDEFGVRIEGAQGKQVRFLLSDTNGRTISNKSVEVTDRQHDERIRFQQQGTGLYLLRVSTGQQSLTLKVIKQ